MRNISLALAGLFLLLSLSALADEVKKTETKITDSKSANPNPVSKEETKALSPPSDTSERILFGPSLRIGIPHPLNLAGEVKFNSKWSVAAGVGYLALSLSTNNTPVSVSEFNFDVRGRWHPFSGSFFLGLALGTQSFGGSTTVSESVPGATVPLKINATVSSLFIAPHLGWLWWFKQGLFLGVELGAQIPVSPSTKIEVTAVDSSQSSLVDQATQTADYKTQLANAENVANQAASQVLPYVGLVRFGYLF